MPAKLTPGVTESRGHRSSVIRIHASNYRLQIMGKRSRVVYHESAVTGYDLRVKVTSHRSLVTGHESQVTSHRSRVTGHESQLRVTGHESQLRVTVHESRVMSRSYESQVTGHESQITSHRSRVTSVSLFAVEMSKEAHLQTPGCSQKPCCLLQFSLQMASKLVRKIRTRCQNRKHFP